MNTFGSIFLIPIFNCVCCNNHNFQVMQSLKFPGFRWCISVIGQLVSKVIGAASGEAIEMRFTKNGSRHRDRIPESNRPKTKKPNSFKNVQT